MKLVIGCPIYKRSWILDEWIQSILAQSLSLSNIGFVFETSPDDDETVNKLNAWKQLDKRIPHFDIVCREDIPHFEHTDNGRQWTISKYVNMVNLRNSVLSKVRELEPDYYFSLDSDILLKNSNTLELLIAHIKEGADAVNPLMFMTPVGTNFPSVMTWRDSTSNRGYRKKDYPLGTYFKSDVIMAAKMMSKKVYQTVDYEVHPQGEDLGWSLNCRKLGYELFCASYVYAPHIMSPLMYESFKKTGDRRKNVYQLV